MDEIKIYIHEKEHLRNKKIKSVEDMKKGSYKLAKSYEVIIIKNGSPDGREKPVWSKKRAKYLMESHAARIKRMYAREGKEVNIITD